MKFAHFADVHIGSWRDPKMATISTDAFLRALGICREEQVDFILISGDFFNTSLPSIDRLKEVVTALKSLKDDRIPVYVIAGSHDFSPTGKTMLDVLENAGLFVNVMRGTVADGKLKLRFTVDVKTGAKITGIIGRKGMLDHGYYETLDRAALEQESGFKIFMFHTAISELKPKELEKMDAAPLSLLPRGFGYYAGGHVHDVLLREQEGYGLIVYPGPMFPNSFRELEKLGRGGFCIVDVAEKTTARHVPVVLHPVVSLRFDCSHQSPEGVESMATKAIGEASMDDALVTLRFSGVLGRGRPNDIRFDDIVRLCHAKGAYFVMKNTVALTSEEFEEIKADSRGVGDIEHEVITGHAGKIKVARLTAEQEVSLAQSLLRSLSAEKEEGETATTFEKRLLDDVGKILGVKLS